MDKIEMLSRIQEIFCDILDNEDIVLKEDTKSEDIDEWDSLSHIQLIVAIEKAFSVKFTSSEIVSWSNVGEMIDCIQTKG